jgi:endonuclease-3 related protein
VSSGDAGYTAFRVRTIYHVLLASFGPQGWWPAESPLEVVVGAVLTQNTSWKNVEAALRGLRGAGALDAPEALARIPRRDLEELIRPAGFYRRKARTLLDLLSRVGGFAGGWAALLSEDGERLRRWLLETHGIGPETADSIVLYAAGRPRFVVGAYTRRVAARHGIAGRRASYGDVRQLFERALPRSARVMNEYHALLVKLGKVCCRVTPACSTCPIRWDLPGRAGAGGRASRSAIMIRQHHAEGPDLTP